MKKKLNQKLQLKKTAIAKLADNSLTNVKGGGDINPIPTRLGSVCICTVTYTEVTCNTCKLSACLPCL